ncbi:hypothetical protein ANCDUO_13174 [Ancylostoma duodenale]|uniref:Uncharacterized protein n=1 Tax=Ancylostoma duodenale TaxID=51022 RepID=A0A0C2GCN5_9BILA|nr:hypothetical protein ANCDUO_13174 [Ancylostoma duodenale]
MSSSRRLQKELSDLKSCGVKAYESVEYDESNFLHWTVLLVPEIMYSAAKLFRRVENFHIGVKSKKTEFGQRYMIICILSYGAVLEFLHR